MVVVLLGFLGLVAGYALTIRFPSYEHGSDRAAIRAESQAIRDVIAANNGKVEGVQGGLAGRFYPLDYALDGLLAGVGIALGFLVSPRSRVTPVH